MFTRRPQLTDHPLKPFVVEEPFKQWGLDFIGPVNPSSSVVHSYILIATNYFIKWVKAISTKRMTTKVVCDFLENNILVRFGVPQIIVTDNISYFTSQELMMFCYDHGISLVNSSNYYPQGNSQVESSNKKMVNIMKKLVDENTKT